MFLEATVLKFYLLDFVDHLTVLGADLIGYPVAVTVQPVAAADVATKVAQAAMNSHLL